MEWERALTCVKTPTSARELAQECRSMCIDGEQRRTADRSADQLVIARNEDMYCDPNVSNAR